MNFFKKNLENKNYPEHIYIPSEIEFKSADVLFSIIIPTYNRIQFLEETIKSSLRQTYELVEILFVMHGASYENKKIVLDYKSKNKNIAIVDIKKNYGQLGVLDCWNMGLYYSKGKYVFVLSDDDFLSENYVEKMVKLFKDNKHCVTAAPLPVSVDENSNINPGDYFSINNRSRYTNGKKLAVNFINEWLDPSLPKSFSAPGLIFSVKKNLILNLGGFDFNTDDSQILKHAIFGDSGFDPEAKLYWRHHNNQSNVVLKSKGNIFFKYTEVGITQSRVLDIWRKKFDNDQYKLLLKYIEFKKIFNITGVFSEALRKKSPVLVLKVMLNILKECPPNVIGKVYLGICIRLIKYFKKNIVKYL
jgi:glycosyltransferase involved in cell wall biosynthesis